MLQKVEQSDRDCMNPDLSEDTVMFLRQTVHSLNNILSIIDGARRVLNKDIESEQGQKMLIQIENAVRRGGFLAQDVRDFATPPPERDIVFDDCSDNDLGFSVSGLTLMSIGDFDTDCLNCAGFKALKAQSIGEALFLQDDYDGIIDFVILHDDLDPKEVSEEMRLIVSMRPDACFLVSEHLGVDLGLYMNLMAQAGCISLYKTHDELMNALWQGSEAISKKSKRRKQ